MLITVISSVSGSERAFSHHQQTYHLYTGYNSKGRHPVQNHINNNQTLPDHNVFMAVALNSLFIQLHLTFITDTLVSRCRCIVMGSIGCCLCQFIITLSVDFVDIDVMGSLRYVDLLKGGGFKA